MHTSKSKNTCYIFGLSAIASGALIGGAASFLGGERRNAAQISSAKDQMEFQKMMSDTAHQREIIDLKAAGLNPILSGTGGRGASSPSGAQAKIADTISPAVTTALGVARMTQELDNMKAQEDLITEQANKVRQETKNLGAGFHTINLQGTIDREKLIQITKALEAVGVTREGVAEVRKVIGDAIQNPKKTAIDAWKAGKEVLHKVLPPATYEAIFGKDKQFDNPHIWGIEKDHKPQPTTAKDVKDITDVGWGNLSP